MTGRFEVFEDKSGRWRFRLVAANGEIVAAGEAYGSKSDARRGCQAVLTAAGLDPDALTADGRPAAAPIEEV